MPNVIKWKMVGRKLAVAGTFLSVLLLAMPQAQAQQKKSTGLLLRTAKSAAVAPASTVTTPAPAAVTATPIVTAAPAASSEAVVPAATVSVAAPMTTTMLDTQAPVDPDFQVVLHKMTAEKAAVNATHAALLAERYDLSDQPSKDVTQSRGKPIQTGVRVKLPEGVDSWEILAAMTPEEIRAKGLYPKGFMPLPFPNHPEGGMLFPQHHINEILRQEGRDLTRFDLDYDLPEHLLPEYPPAIYLTTHPEAGDVSQGQVITIDNYYATFKNLLNPKQLEGLRLLVTPFPQQQFNMTDDRRTERPSRGVSCFDCHVNGHTNGATHLVGDIRPQELRHRIDVPTLRGVNVQRLFGSQRALKTIEDFTQFEQMAAYFDGDIALAAKKGINLPDRTAQVHYMAEFESILDFPPAPKLDIFGKLDTSKATEAELRGEEIFNKKGRCGECHPAPYYTDNTMHDMQTSRFFESGTMVAQSGMKAVADGTIKTFPLRGLKDSAPYWHDGRLLTIEDTVEYHNLLLGTRLTTDEKADLVEFLRAL